MKSIFKFKYGILASTTIAAILFFALISQAQASLLPMSNQNNQSNSSNSPQPADVYCNDLQQGIDEAYKKAMQNRMPTQTPGGHMDENYDVQKTIQQEVNYGLGSASDILNALFSFVASKMDGYKERLILDTVNKTMQEAMKGTNSGVSMPSQANTPVSDRTTTSHIPSPANPAVGHSAIAQQNNSNGIVSKVSDFFSNLFR